MSDSSCLIVIPTYNEKENLPQVLRQIRDHLSEAHCLIVDDGSPDGTGDLADQIAQEDSRVSVLHRSEKAGLGKAYLAGFAWALERNYEYIFEMDADLSHPAEALPRLLNAVHQGADVALGSRWIEGGGVEGWPLKRKVLSLGGSWYARSVLGISIRDVTGGFKCFKRTVLEQLDLDQVVTAGYGFQIELTWRALKAGFQVTEVPIIFTDRIAGQSKMSTDIFVEALSLVWKLRLGKIS
jgi:dolichol-phosphate mannosyltransferase